VVEREWRTKLIAVATDAEGRAVPVSVGLVASGGRLDTIAMQIDDGATVWFQPEAAAEHVSNVRHIVAEKQRIDGEL
jgi:hypothetical protein